MCLSVVIDVLLVVAINTDVQDQMYVQFVILSVSTGIYVYTFINYLFP